MPLSSKNINLCETHLNHLATELALSEIGTQNNLVPIYSLLNALVDCLKELEGLHESCKPVINHFSQMLDQAANFSENDTAYLGEFIEWACQMLEDVQMERPIHAFESHLNAAKEVAVEVARETRPPMPIQGTSEMPIAIEASAMPLAEINVPQVIAPDTRDDVLLELNPAQDQELLQEFKTEAADHLEQIEASLLVLEKNPSDADTLNSLFRSFHTIKGVSGFLKLVPVQRLAHEVESLMDHARKGKLILSSSMITLILQVQDAMRAFLQQITNALEQNILPTEVIPVSHLIAQVKQFAQMGIGGTIAQGEKVELAFTPPPATPTESAPVASEAAAPEVVAKNPSGYVTKASTASPFKPNNTPAPFKANSTHAPFEKEKGAPVAETATIRVNTGKLDSLMDVVGELVIIQSQLQESLQTAQGHSDRQRSFSQLSRITKELQRTSMSLRMVPIKPSFQKVSRMVRDLAKSSGKQVELHLFGEETELDRNVVEQIGDPLVHMIRNAIDHGIETPEDRSKAGKNPTGRIELKAYHMGSNIIIEMSDDGHGINAKKVHAKAISSGIVSQEDNLSEQDMIELIFAPGLSTAEKVTDISGRGVGMDVVKKNIEQMRGNVEVSTTLGQGTTFKIKLPLTMAIIDGLIVGVGEDRFILPTNSVKIALRPTAESLSMLQGKTQLLHWRGQSIPIIQLSKHFQIPAKTEQAVEGIVVILDIFGKSYGLLVDDLLSKQEVVIKNLGNLLQNRPGVAGGAILGDGSIALIIDPVGLCNQALRMSNEKTTNAVV